MASKPQSQPQPQLAHPVASPQHFAPPTARELRNEAIHRLQVGLLGLCAVLLIVALANIIMDRARLAEVENPSLASAPETSAADAVAADPLADIGVAPAADASAGPMREPEAR